ncbi:MAG: metallophosphoesterase [Bradymonadia bacterium]
MRALVILLLFSALSCRSNIRQKVVPVDPGQMTSLYAHHEGKERLVILNYGDAGDPSNGEYQQMTANLMHAICQAKQCDFALVNGDNIYERGVSSEDDDAFLSHFENIYEKFGRFDFWSVLGNHDWRLSAQGEVNYTLKSTRWRMPHAWFEVPALPDWITIFGLDTTIIHTRIKLDDPKQTNEWEARVAEQHASAKRALCNGKGGWKLIFSHHFHYTSSVKRIGDNNRNMHQLIDPLIRECGVQVFSAGHDHHLELLHVDSNASAFEEHGPYVQIISGAGGRKVRELVPSDDPRVKDRKGVHQRFARQQYGFNLLIFTPDTLTIEFYTIDQPDQTPVHTETYHLSDFEKDTLQ